MPLTRRSLISRGALLVTAGLLAPSFITRTALALDGPIAIDPTKKNRVLVVLQLSGGNDGINTLIPFGDPNYAKLRPTLGLGSNEVLPLTDTVGLHPGLAKLKALYD